MPLKRLLRYCRTDSTKRTITLESEDVYYVLSSRRRRLALLCLDDYDEPTPLAELAVDVTAKETGQDRSDLPEDTREAIYISLYQSHLPVLDELGVVAWDRQTRIVRSGASVAGLAALIDDIAERTTRE